MTPANPGLAAAGGILIIVAFISFFCSYTVFLASRINKQTRPPARSARNPEKEE